MLRGLVSQPRVEPSMSVRRKVTVPTGSEKPGSLGSVTADTGSSNHETGSGRTGGTVG
jgi:hypothetical protein